MTLDSIALHLDAVIPCLSPLATSPMLLNLVPPMLQIIITQTHPPILTRLPQRIIILSPRNHIYSRPRPIIQVNPVPPHLPSLNVLALNQFYPSSL